MHLVKKIKNKYGHQKVLKCSSIAVTVTLFIFFILIRVFFIDMAAFCKMAVKSMDKSLHDQTSSKNVQTIHINWFENLPWIPNTFNFQQCEYQNCDIYQSTNTSNSKAVIFHYRRLRSMPPAKPKHQIWILWNSESPANDNPLPVVWNGLFDWTITYRLDSEITNQRQIVPRNKNVTKNYSQIYHRKKKFAVLAMSNCDAPSRRNEYVKELSKYIDVDVFGKCSSQNNPCKNISNKQCHLSFSRDYKFFLGFENSICKDYVTEKLSFSYIDENDMVYVYRGAPNADDLVPKNTFINTASFDGPKALAKFLIQIGSNEKDYTSFLKEKDKYTLLDNKIKRSLCSLCKLLNTNPSKTSYRKTDFNKWYRDGACKTPTDL